MFQYSADELRAIADVLEHLDAANGNEQHDLFLLAKLKFFGSTERLAGCQSPKIFGTMYRQQRRRKKVSSNQIPGVPDGWELAHANRLAEAGEFILTEEGNPYMTNTGSARPFPIICKIEKPAAYRPFKDAEEYLPHWGRPIRLKGRVGFDSVVSTSRTGVYVADGSSIIRHEMADAFKRFEFADGTAFGVRIDG